MATRALLEPLAIDAGISAPDLVETPERGKGFWARRLSHEPAGIARLRWLLHAQSRIESRIVMLQWVVMVLVGIGAVLPGRLGSELGAITSSFVLLVLALHPICYLSAATFSYNWLRRNSAARIAVLSAIDISVAVGVLFLTATQPGYTQVLLFSVVLLTATRYSLSRALGITTMLSILQFFAILASNHLGLQITNLSSAVVAMFALTYGVNQLSQAERKEAAIAAENARLYRAVLLRNRELATINSLSLAASQDTDADRLLQSGLELILSSIPVAWGQAFLYDRQTQEMDLLFIRQACRCEPNRDAADRREAAQAARARAVVVGATSVQGGEILVRVSVPVLVQGTTAGVLQALVPLTQVETTNDPPAQSLTIVCQELGTSVEKALLRDAAQRSLVLEEKNRIARELHDTVLQILFSLGLGVDWCLQRIGTDPALTPKLSDMRRLTAQASSELRSAIYTLSSTVAEIGLLPALEMLSAGFSEQYELPVSLSTKGQQPPDLPVLMQNALHRVVRESLMNAFKHAQASHIAVRVVFERAAITVIVQDDGVGIPPLVLEMYANDPTHFGLRTVALQIQELHGHLEVLNGEDGGAIIRASVPLTTILEEIPSG